MPESEEWVSPPAAAEDPPVKPKWRVPPIVAGFVLDAVDFMTMGPVGLSGGFVLGGLAGWWAARELGLSGRSVWLATFAGAVYAATPATELLPLGTLVGLAVQFGRRG